jgi:hypothetical protein
MNLRSTILQTGALAFCIGVITLSLTGYSILVIVIISFILFFVVTLVATVIVSIYFPPPKEIEKKSDLLTDNTNILDDAMSNEKTDAPNIERNKDIKEEPQPVEANNATAKE